MRIATYLIVILFTTLALSSSMVLAEEDVYRWVDENGVVHFGSRPEGHGDAEKVKLHKSPDYSPTESEQESIYQDDAGPSYAQKLRDERAEERQAATKKSKEIEEECNWHKDRITKLEPQPRVLVEKEDGSVERMDDNDRLERLRESKDFVSRNCRH